MVRLRMGQLWIKKRYLGKTRLEVTKLKILGKRINHFLAFAFIAENIHEKNMFLAFAALYCEQRDEIDRDLIGLHTTKERLYLNFESVKVDECSAKFRFFKKDLHRILKCFGLKDFRDTNGAIVLAEEALLVTFCRFARPRTLLDLEDIFGGELSRISRIVTYVMKFLYSRHWFRVKDALRFWAPYLPASKRAFQLKAMDTNGGNVPRLFENCGVSGDGTLLSTCRRTGALQRNMYGHKGHGLAFHGVYDARGICLDMAGPFVGRYNDLMMVAECNLEERFQEALASVPGGDQNIHIVCDKLYVTGDVIKAMYKGDMTDAAAHDNTIISPIRTNCAELGFGQIEEIWKGLFTVRAIKPGESPYGMFYLVCVLFQNVYTLLYGGHSQEYFNSTNGIPEMLALPENILELYFEFQRFVNVNE